MSPIAFSGGTSIPDSVAYQPLLPAKTRDFDGSTIGPERNPRDGEPAAAANYFNGALQNMTATMNAILRALAATGTRVFNEATGQWEVWPTYISATDPNLGTNPPQGDYVWLNTTAMGAGSPPATGGAIAFDSDGVPYFVSPGEVGSSSLAVDTDGVPYYA